MKHVAILGASGYTGRELTRLIARHPAMQIAVQMTARAGSIPDAPALPGDPVIEKLDLERLTGLDGVFLCTPHGAAAELVRQILPSGLKVVDLSADFRIKDQALYARTYGTPHAAPELLGEAVYGLTEHARNKVAAARLVANPGCYPTSVLLPLKPLLAAGLLDQGATIIADAKSGVSGAGKNPTERTHFGNVHENFLAYGVGTHRHAPEIHQEAGTPKIAFVPHLLPVFRGILTTLYLTVRQGIDASRIQTVLTEAYAGEPFVRVHDRGQPELRGVQFSNRCDMAVAEVAGQVVITSVIDNLVKGASGQALQNMNLMLGLPETAGLL